MAHSHNFPDNLYAMKDTEQYQGCSETRVHGHKCSGESY